MLTEDDIKKALSKVLVPGVRRSIMQLNLVRSIEIPGGYRKTKISLASTALDAATQDWIRAQVCSAIEELPEASGVTLEFVQVPVQDLNQIGHIIAVISGKGGVGKSLVTSLLAIALNREGYEVGILDADITGPSIPRMFGPSARPTGSETGILPVLSRSGIEIMSINLLLPHEDDALVWRGSHIGKAIQQFWQEVLWGRLDYLLVDLPPGTADASLTVMQLLPLSGVIVAFTPQDLTAMIVKKAVKMTQIMNTPILGVVENMSYFLLPEMGKKIEIFGKSKGEEMAHAAGAPLLGQLPLDPELARLCDQGDIESYSSDAFVAFARTSLRALPRRRKKSQYGTTEI